MRKVLMTCVALLSMLAGPSLAQQAIPSGNAVDIPAPAGPSSTGAAPGTSALPDTGPGSGGGMTGLRPMRGQPKQAVGMHHFTHKPLPAPVRSTTRRRSTRKTPASTTGDNGVPSGGAQPSKAG